MIRRSRLRGYVAGVPQGITRFLDVVERRRAGTGDLNFLVAFSGDQHDVAGLCLR